MTGARAREWAQDWGLSIATGILALVLVIGLFSAALYARSAYNLSHKDTILLTQHSDEIQEVAIAVNSETAFLQRITTAQKTGQNLLKVIEQDDKDVKSLLATIDKDEKSGGKVTLQFTEAVQQMESQLTAIETKLGIPSEKNH